MLKRNLERNAREELSARLNRPRHRAMKIRGGGGGMKFRVGQEKRGEKSGFRLPASPAGNGWKEQRVCADRKKRGAEKLVRRSYPLPVNLMAHLVFPDGGKPPAATAGNRDDLRKHLFCSDDVFNPRKRRGEILNEGESRKTAWRGKKDLPKKPRVGGPNSERRPCAVKGTRGATGRDLSPDHRTREKIMSETNQLNEERKKRVDERMAHTEN